MHMISKKDLNDAEMDTLTILLKHGWEKFQIGNVSLYIVKKDYSYLCMWMT